MVAQTIKALEAENKSLKQAHRFLQTDHQQLQQQLHFALTQIAKYEEEIRLARAEKFAANSEQHPQYALFNEAEQVQTGGAEEVIETETIAVPAHTRKVPKRKPLPKDLPRVIVEHDLDDKQCSCGTEKVRIGTKSSEQLDVIPAQVFVIEHQRHSYKCPYCEDARPETAPLPAQPIPKSYASPGLLAHVAISKYDDGLPLYRQSKMFERMGVDLPRQTLASHMVRAGELIAPLVECMTTQALQYDVIQVDETRVQVLDEDNRRAQSQSWMWVIRGGPPDKPVISFNYDQSRAGSVAKHLLDGYQGYVQTDGYKAYGKVLAVPGIDGLGCWAHVRRKFFKAQQAQPANKQSARLHQILSWVSKLYSLEKQWQSLAPDDRRQRRMAQSKPILDQIEAWMGKQNVNPQSLLGRAIAYMQNEWPRLIVYLEDGRLNIDNNLVENAIRPFALGRKNWLFSQSVVGARSSAALYSLVETAHANDINPYCYLKHVFTELPGISSKKELDSLLPWNVSATVLDKYLVPTKT
jgi:transposase|tara:strand:- start:699 stop:2270 length:1572 start_codon:yes stop_codon:yes gene_type:complete